MMVQEASHLGPEPFVNTASFAEPGVAPRGVDPQRTGEQVANLFPGSIHHSSPPAYHAVGDPAQFIVG
jgi:hypothetical protein